MLDIHHIISLFTDAQKTKSKRGNPRELYISVPPDMLFDVSLFLQKKRYQMVSRLSATTHQHG